MTTGRDEQITVLMPAYNASKYLAEAIRSVQAQTHTLFTLRIINDGSTDGTLEIADRFASMDSRISVLTTKNQGVGHAMNLGLRLADTEFIAVMHADDIMRPNRLEEQIRFMREHPELSFASSLVNHIDGDGRIIGKDNSKLTTHEAVQKQIEANELIGFNHPAVILKREAALAVGGYRQQYWPAEDIDLWNRLVEQDYKVLVQPQFLLQYRVHGSSASIYSARLTRFKLRWLKDSMIRRRRGQDELDEAGFVAYEAERSWSAKMNQERMDMARIFYKAAVAAYAQKKYFHTAAKAAIAVTLRPVVMSREVTSKLSVARG